jgi:hypothetical protein
LCAALDLQLSKEVVDMRFCGRYAYIQAACDIFIAHPCGNHLSNLLFPRGERGNTRHFVRPINLRPENGQPAQQGGGDSCGTSLLAAPDVDEQWENLGDAACSWNIAGDARLAPSYE